jgi:hypothetical protein
MDHESRAAVCPNAQWQLWVDAPETAVAMANHASARKTQLLIGDATLSAYTSVERIAIWTKAVQPLRQ